MDVYNFSSQKKYIAKNTVFDGDFRDSHLYIEYSNQ